MHAASRRPDHQSWRHGEADPLVINPKAPYDIARSFQIALFMKGGRSTLHRHRGGFYHWNGTVFLETDAEELKAKVYAFLDRCVAIDAKGEQRPVKPNMRMVGAVLDALAAVVQLDGKITPPAWLDPVPTSCLAEEIISCANGLLDLRTRKLLPHTPSFFTHNALDYAFNPSAAEPKQWLKFLHQLWPDDQAAIDTLQEIFGYCLTPTRRNRRCSWSSGPSAAGRARSRACSLA